jgi:hypothetical protein
MKAIKFITHPVTLIICFSFVLISGEHLGGFYLLYILLGLPHGAIHSLLAVGGISLLLFCNMKFKREFNQLAEPVLNIIGVLLLSSSLFLFFYRDSDHYNYATFYQTVPQISLAVFAVLIVSFLINNLYKLRHAATL